MVEHGPRAARGKRTLETIRDTLQLRLLLLERALHLLNIRSHPLDRLAVVANPSLRLGPRMRVVLQTLLELLDLGQRRLLLLLQLHVGAVEHGEMLGDLVGCLLDFLESGTSEHMRAQERRATPYLGVLDEGVVLGLKILDLLASASLRCDLGLQLGSSGGLGWSIMRSARAQSRRKRDCGTHDVLLELQRVLVRLVHVNLEQSRLVVRELILVTEVAVGLFLAAL